MTSAKRPPSWQTADTKDLFGLIHEQERLARLCKKNWAIPRIMLTGLEDEDVAVNFVINGNEYIPLRKYLAQFNDSHTNGDKGLNRLSYKAYLLFGSVQKLQAFSKSCNAENANHIRNKSPAAYLKEIQFPPSDSWANINFRKWGEAFLSPYHFKDINKRFHKGSPHADPVRSGRGNISLLHTDFAIAAAEKRNSGNAHYIEKLVELAIRFRKNTDEFSRALKHMMQSYKEHALQPDEMMPPFCIDGAEFGISGAVFRKMEHNDPRLLFLGDYTDCCERVTDTKCNLEDTVAQALTTNRNAYYIVECEGEILTHSWAWRGNRGEMVFDGFESKENNFNFRNLEELLLSVKERIKDDAHSYYEINGLYIGRTAPHLALALRRRLGISHPLIMPDHIRGVGMTQSDLSEFSKAKWRTFETSAVLSLPKPRSHDIRLG